MPEFPKKYNPESFEWDIYSSWEKAWKFTPVKGKTRKKYYIPIPPPNVTWNLHLGHALFLTIEDLMTRYHRMKGDKTLWLPWTDHAWISTQAVVEKKLATEWKSKHDLWREDFVKEVWRWKDKYHKNISNQIRKMWASCDWEMERFTLDEGLNKVVNQAFVDLFNRWLIYQWEYMVNFSPKLQTVLSDAEVEYKEEKWKLYYITYFVSWSDAEMLVATTRPETLFWDVAIAVHPKDKRYKRFIGKKKVILPIVNKEIPIIADEMVDMEFGTWAVKITPAHDSNDFDVAKRHNLPLDNIVLDQNGNMTDKAWIFAGQDFQTARENIVELLRSKWNLDHEEDHISRVWYCERSGCKVETIISKQWFVKVAPLVKKVMRGYKKKDFEIIPKKFNKTFEDWMGNLRDWCISRQLWWGHQIPVYYHNETGKAVASVEDLSKTWEYTRDPDVLDTWFSSWLWPFSVLDHDLDNPDKRSKLMKEYYPADVLETGYDILFFWIIRMLLFGYEFTGEAPFKKIYLHGIIRDKHGRKMSKSLWNGVDPLEIIKEYGTDALRLTMGVWNTPWNDVKFDIDNVKNNKLFMNKLWNAVRFVYKNILEDKKTVKFDMKDISKKLAKDYDKLLFHEKWVLSRLKYVSDLVTEWMEKYSFSDAWLELQTFTKNEFCDYYIEEFKLTKDSKYWNEVIMYVIYNLLKLWHPFIPYITEELYARLGFEGMLIDADWDEVLVKRDLDIEKSKRIIIDTIKIIRNIRAENNVIPSEKIKLILYAKSEKNQEILNEFLTVISWIVNSEETQVVDKKPKDDDFAYGVVKAWIEVFVDTSNALDLDKERERIRFHITDAKEYIWVLDKKLLNENFVRKAPESLVRAEMEKKEQAQERLKKLKEKLQALEE